MSTKIYTAVMLLLLLLSPAVAKEYDLSDVQIRATLSAQGTLSIEESRTYVFRGSFTWADYRLPLEKLGEVRNFRLSENDVQYMEGQDEQPGSYTCSQSESELYVRWYYQAGNETRTFKLQYDVSAAIVAYEDVAEFYYKFVGEKNPGTIGRVEVWLQLPQPADTARVRAWVHGPLHGTVSFVDGYLYYYIAPLPADNYWETRVLIPAAWIAGQARHVSGNLLPVALQEEKAWADDANQRREQAVHDAESQEERAGKAMQLSWILCAVGITVWLVLFLKNGMPVSVPYTQDIDPNYPQDMPPALVSALYYDKQVYSSALTSTLFDLARKGFIILEHNPDLAKRWWQSKKNQIVFRLNRRKFEQERSILLDYEQDLISFLFDRLSSGKTDEITAAIMDKKAGKVRSWFREWSKLVKKHLASIPVFDRQSSRATVIAAAVSIVIIISGILLAIFLNEIAFISILGGVICLGLSFVIFRYTADIRLKKKQWKAFRRYIRSFKQAPGDFRLKLGTVNQYLVYALALGVGEKDLRNVLAAVPEDEYKNCFPWFIFAAHGGVTSPAGGLAATLSSVINVAGSALSSAAGAGGGASAGAGAGAGGAAGGAG